MRTKRQPLYVGDVGGGAGGGGAATQYPVALNEITDVEIASEAQGDILIKGESAWVNLAKATEADRKKFLRTGTTPAYEEITKNEIMFLDNFDDAAIGWPWQTHNVGSGRSIAESDGVLNIAGTAGTNMDLWTSSNNAPKLFMGLPAWDCEIVTKATISGDRAAGQHWGIFITCLGIDQYGSAGFILWGPQGANILEAVSTPTSIVQVASKSDATYWLKIRRCGGWLGNGTLLNFLYSTDGNTWTDAGTSLANWTNTAAAGMRVGLFAKTWNPGSGIPALSVDFEFFKIVRPLTSG